MNLPSARGGLPEEEESPRGPQAKSPESYPKRTAVYLVAETFSGPEKRSLEETSPRTPGPGPGQRSGALRPKRGAARVPRPGACEGQGPRVPRPFRPGPRRWSPRRGRPRPTSTRLPRLRAASPPRAGTDPSTPQEELAATSRSPALAMMVESCKTKDRFPPDLRAPSRNARRKTGQGLAVTRRFRGSGPKTARLFHSPPRRPRGVTSKEATAVRGSGPRTLVTAARVA